MVKGDPISQLYQDDQLITLPSCWCAHEMPDKVSEWHEFLKNLTNNFDMIFSDQLSEAANLLSDKEFEILFNALECAVCQLGGDNSQPFASSFYHEAVNRIVTNGSAYFICIQGQVRKAAQACLGPIVKVPDMITK
ncbi:2430_t:CDS:2 [Funneliformis mosseae]|uniref:2430_t:CDS:1 n=1 Tax=Funneliformis mosseae TaxID=27381 RepID=A0A9N9AAW1_FUNMO|nr:2430_t:CDS:2 [Funneliformis mosseae]